MQNLLQVRQHKIMPIYPSEILSYFLKIQKPNNINDLLKVEENKKVEFVFVDCRLENKLIMLPKTIQIPKHIEIKEVFFKF